MRAVLPGIHLESGGTNHRPGHAQLQHIFHWQSAYALSTVDKDRIGSK